MNFTGKWFITSTDLTLNDNNANDDNFSVNQRNENGPSKQWHFHVLRSGKFNEQQVLLFKSGCARDPMSYGKTTVKKIHDMMLVKNVNLVCFLGIL